MPGLDVETPFRMTRYEDAWASRRALEVKCIISIVVIIIIIIIIINIIIYLLFIVLY